MRIRRFFEHKEDGLYMRVRDWFSSTHRQTISPKDREKLITIFPLLRKPNEAGKGYVSNSKLIFGKGSGRIDIDIYFDEDEWYLVRMIFRSDDTAKFFKCDQLEGLVDCILIVHSYLSLMISSKV